MPKVEGYWDVVPKIKNVYFPVRGKFAVTLEDCQLSTNTKYTPTIIIRTPIQRV